jgi:hypothetical protein
MRRSVVRLALALSAGAVLATATQAASREPLTKFAIAPERGAADTLALCDLTAFLETDPNLDADTIVAPDDRGRGFRQPMRHPWFRPPDLVFDNKVRRAVQRLEGAGLIRREAIANARASYDAQMLDSWRYSTPAERRFLDAQLNRCGKMLDRYIDAPLAQLRTELHAVP